MLVAGELLGVEPAYEPERSHNGCRLPLGARGLQLLDHLAEDGRVIREGRQRGGGDLRTQREAARRQLHQRLRVRV